jgi:AcrR family transcriptional regulator
MSLCSRFLLAVRSPPRSARKKRSSREREPSQQRARETVEAIVSATAHILRREGPGRLTTNRIAQKAGVSIGSLYQYFRDKDAIVVEVRRRFEAEFQDRFVAGLVRVGSLPLRDAVAELVRALVALHAEDPGLHNAVGSGIPETQRPLLEQIVASYLEARRRELRRKDLALAATVTLDVAEALVHGVAVRSPERLHDEAFVAEVTDLLTRYLAR